MHQSSGLSAAMRMPAVILLLLAVISISISRSQACPQPVAQVCQCADLHNGVILDCSNNNASNTLNILRVNQALLGLIQSLTIRNAGLTEIPDSFFAGLFIKKLDASFNQMMSIGDRAFHGIGPVLQELILTHNNLTKIPIKAIGGLPALLRLDLSNNTIDEIGENDVFPILSKLYDVNLGSNKINNVHTNAFQNVRNSIQTINLGHNRLTAVPSSAIRGLKQLQSLHLHKNEIRQLESLNFLNLPVLNLLNLASNQITELNRQAFLNVPNLRYLYLTDNKISTLLPHQFASFDQLEMLDLTNNLIDKIPSECFSQLSQLRQLYLGNNRIQKIEPNAFTNSSIVLLVLSGNQLTKLEEGVVSGLPSIQRISLKGNQIKEIHQNAFYNAPSLVMIDLSDNVLQDVAPSTFLAQLNLILIDLSGNKIIRTPYAAFNRRVGTVLLKENPLVCTEKIHMLQDGTGINIQESEDILCGGKPKPKLAATPLTQVPKLSLRNSRPLISSPDNFQDQAESQEHVSEFTSPLPQINIPRRAPSRFVEEPTIQRLSTVDSTHLNTKLEPAAEEIQKPLPESEQFSSDPAQPTVPVLPMRNEPEVETTLGPRLYTDIADNPNIIHPFPVPFLKRGPSMNKASRVTDLPAEVHTLPPSIVIEPGRILPSNTSNINNNEDRFEEFALHSQPIEGSHEEKGHSKMSFSTTIVVIFVGLALVVMVVVSIGLCVSRHRYLQRHESSYSESSAARANDYVTAQAQFNSLYNNPPYSRSTARFDDSQPWIYNPGANYCNYYK